MTEPTTAPGSDSIPFLPSALEYAARGWRVLTVYPGEKRPSMKDWPTEASSDPDAVRDLWVQRPDSNIGIATGAGSGFFVLDIDPKNGGDESLTDLCIEHGALPRTRTVRTGSGGTHYYFAMPDFEVTNSPGRLKGTGIDVRGEGGQVLAPPSVTALGDYRLQLDAAILPAPAWLLDLIRPAELRVVDGEKLSRVDRADLPRQRSYAVNVALPSAARSVEETTEGGRNQRLNDNVLALAGIAAHDSTLLTYDEALDAMEKACRANGLIEEDGRRSFLATFESAWSAGLQRPREDWPPRERGDADGLYFGPIAGQLPIVNTSARKLNEVVDEVLANIDEANTHDPSLFAHGSEVVKVVGQPGRTAALDKHMLAYEADTRMHFVKTMPNGGQAVTQAPARVVDTIMSLPEKPFPELDRLSYTPFFSPSGRYVSEAGYDREAHTFYAPALGVEVPPFPEEPTRAQVKGARHLLVEELLGDFPFVADADRAHAVALMLLPFVRDLIDGATPLHNIEAPTPGSGKGLLMKALLMPGVGGRHVTCGAAADNEEWEKRLVSFLRLSPQALVIDNVNEKVTSGFLCTALTEPVITSRLLGVSQQVTIPVRSAWVMTANNPKFSDEVARRTIRIRVDAGVEHPEDRAGFRHPDLLAWAAARRGALIAACCLLVQSWFVAGAPRPVAAKPFGSFEAWQSVMSGLLDHIGVPGLLDNKADFMAVSDDESNAWDQLVDLLLSSVETEWSASVIADVVVDNGIAIDLPGTNRALMMGRELGRQRDRWHRGRTFTSRVVKGQTKWRLTRREDLKPDL